MPNLVGIGNSQVPTNAMLGGLAYQDPAHANLTSVEIENIAAIKAKTSDTAVDIFVYDTRKDSDGGAWRKRTKDTSWYNEGQGPHRGHRKEFPAVAVIVASSSALTIYDADDPNCSMWMVFVNDNDKWLKHTSSGPNSVVALNGNVVSCGSGTGRLSIVNFVSDNGYVTEPGYTYRHNWIATRNSTGVGGADSNDTVNPRHILNIDCKDVAITVLPNAPIDDSTGLPIPTIAVATEHGISIIKDDGNVVDMTTTYTTSNYRRVYEIYFTKSNDISFRTNANWVYYYTLPTSDVSDTYWNSLAGFIGRFTDTTRSWAENGLPINVAANGITNFLPDRAVGHTNGLELTDITDSTNRHFGYGALVGYGMRCSISESFNTGWMVGDVKGAWLADIDDTDIVSSELLTNGNFSNGTTGWTERESGGTFTVSGGQATMTYSSGATSWQTTATVVVGKTYTISFDIVSSSIAGIQAYYDNGSGGVAISVAGTGAFKATKTFVATSTSVTIWPRLPSSGNMVLDNFSLKESVDDRTEGPEGLQVNGTVAKTSVATGAELVGYGPFSTSNFLYQPYAGNSTYPGIHHYEAGDFHVMFWMNNSGSDSHQSLVGRDNREFAVDILDNSSYSRRFRIYAQNSSNSLQFFDSTNTPFSINSWNHVCVNFTNGNMCTVYVNGVFNKTGTFSGTGDYDIDDTTNGLIIGCRNTSGNKIHPASETKLSLVRVGKRVPTPKQLKKIYEDEKQLFQENAKCTLYGDTHKSVIAMAYDDSNDVLHVGTSSGRNDFRGLNRINNTTTAVTTAISASNGLVAEQ